MLTTGGKSITSMVKIFAWYDNEWGYSNRLIKQVIDIDRSQDPVGTSLNILFGQHGIQRSQIERKMLTAGVELFFADETGERNRKLRIEIREFLTEVYEGSVPVNVVKAISKLVPVPPIHLENVCSTNRNIFVRPNYDPDFGIPLPYVRYH